MRSSLSLILATVVSLACSLGAQAPDCRDAQACRLAALEAAARQDYDQFHDLAWKALNLGPKNDPESMALLARAQSLSGRPHDALVMLNRLAAMNVATDAATSDDFRNVRDLPAWAEFEAKLAGKSLPPASIAAPAPVPAGSSPPPVSDKPKNAAAAEPAPVTAAPVRESKPAKPPARVAATPLTFPASALRTTVGLAYDGVSGRFIVGDGEDRRLMVLGERSGRLDRLAGVDAGFQQITAFEIDGHEGDLWVVSTSPESKASTVHKLQLISGRVLFSVPLPEEARPGRFTDVTVTPQSVFVLDGEGRRVYRLAKKGKSLELAVRLAAPDVASLAVTQEGVAYVAYDTGVLKVDLTSRTTAVIETGENVSLAGLTWLRAIRGSLVGIQRTSGGYQLVRIRLEENGRSARSLEIVEAGQVVAGPTSATIVGNTLHYLSRTAGSDDVSIRKTVLK